MKLHVRNLRFPARDWSTLLKVQVKKVKEWGGSLSHGLPALLSSKVLFTSINFFLLHAKFKGMSASEVEIFLSSYLEFLFLFYDHYSSWLVLKHGPPIVEANFYNHLILNLHVWCQLTKGFRHCAITFLRRKKLPATKTTKFTSGEGKAEK